MFNKHMIHEYSHCCTSSDQSLNNKYYLSLKTSLIARKVFNHNINEKHLFYFYFVLKHPTIDNTSLNEYQSVIELLNITTISCF